jgi:hypothetical protein
MAITEIDELGHTPADAPVWRESLYFCFHDIDSGIGGMTTIGVLPNQDRAQSYAAIFFGPKVLYSYVETPLSEGGAGLYSVPGTRYEMLLPLQTWRVAVTADFQPIDPLQVVRGAPLRVGTAPARFDISFDALSPAYEFPSEAYGLLAGKARHFEQTGRTIGTIFVEGQTLTVDGFGFRDHSWGIRDLAKVTNVVGVYAQLGTNLTVNALRGVRGGSEIAIGYISRDGENIALDEIQVDIQFDPLFFPRRALAEVGTADGRRVGLQGEVASFMPVLMDHGGGKLCWFECSTQYRHGGLEGYGTLATTRLIPG